jgi:hypothetical protein
LHSPEWEGKNAPERMLTEHAGNTVIKSAVLEDNKSRTISKIAIAENGFNNAGGKSKEILIGNSELHLQTSATSSVANPNRSSVTCDIADQAIKKFLVFSKGQISKTLLRSGFTVPELRSVCEFLGKKVNPDTEPETKLSTLGKEALIQIVIFRLANAQPSAIAPNCMNNPQFSKKRKDSGPSVDTNLKSTTQVDSTKARKPISSEETKQKANKAAASQSGRKLIQVNIV